MILYSDADRLRLAEKCFITFLIQGHKDLTKGYITDHNKMIKEASIHALKAADYFIIAFYEHDDEPIKNYNQQLKPQGFV